MWDMLFKKLAEKRDFSVVVIVNSEQFSHNSLLFSLFTWLG